MELLLIFGSFWGAFNWADSIIDGEFASTGTVMLSVSTDNSWISVITECY